MSIFNQINTTLKLKSLLIKELDYNSKAISASAIGSQVASTLTAAIDNNTTC